MSNKNDVDWEYIAMLVCFTIIMVALIIGSTINGKAL